MALRMHHPAYAAQEEMLSRFYMENGYKAFDVTLRTFVQQKGGYTAPSDDGFEDIGFSYNIPFSKRYVFMSADIFRPDSDRAFSCQDIRFAVFEREGDRRNIIPYQWLESRGLLGEFNELLLELNQHLEKSSQVKP